MYLSKWLMVPAILWPAAAAAQDGSLTITLTDYAFAPAAIVLKANVPAHLRLANDAAKPHSFSAPEFFAAATLAPGDLAKVKRGTVELDGRQSLDLTVTPLRPGSYAVRCTHFLHAAMGMTGSITVQ
jgi:plastocyanin